MKRIIVTIAVLVMSVSLKAQDLHFSQTSQIPQLINPATVGVMDGWERVIVNHRNQWLGAGTQFMTTNIAVDANLFKGHINNRAHLGVGLLFFNDIGGDSNFGTQIGALSISGILPMMGGAHVLSAGLQGGYGIRKADYSSLNFMSQWDGSGFDNSIVSGEVNSSASFRYIDASAGLNYMFDGGQNSFQRNNDFKLQVGIAGYHLNAPELMYTNGTSGERLHRKYVGHASFVSDIAGSVWALNGSGMYARQGGHNETIFGMMLRYRFDNGTKQTGLSQDAFVGLGSYYRWGDAVIPSVMVDWKNFRLGISYDVTVSALRKAYKGGSLEFSLSYTNKYDAIFKTRRRRM